MEGCAAAGSSQQRTCMYACGRWCLLHIHSTTFCLSTLNTSALPCCP
jgi:hypothetical protein